MTLAATSARAADGPAQVVRDFYSVYVFGESPGLPEGPTRQALWPYLSERMRRLLDDATACQLDYIRRHPGEKPPFVEGDVFSGSEQNPTSFEIGPVQALTDGRVQVFVDLRHEAPAGAYGHAPAPARALRRREAVVVQREGGRFVIDDFLRLDAGSKVVTARLSDGLPGCRGPRWVGTR